MMEASQAVLNLGQQASSCLEALRSAFSNSLKVSKADPELERLRREIQELQSKIRILERASVKQVKGGVVVPPVVQFENNEERIAWLEERVREAPLNIDLPERFRREV